MKEQQPTPAAIYARVFSRDVDLSVPDQLKTLRDYARKNDYLVVREYADETEIWDIPDRPRFRRMIDEASKANSPFREVLVWRFSRFTRKREHDVAFKSMLRRKGVRVVSVAEQADDSISHKLLEEIIASVDEFHIENQAWEITSRMRDAASRGFWISSRVPFGYKRVLAQDGRRKRLTLEPDSTSSRIVKRIFELAEAGTGTLDITRTLNDEGVASPRGKPWGKTSVRGILTNEAYTGTLVWGESAPDKAAPVRVEKAFPAIVSRAQFRRVNDLLRSRAPKVAHLRRVGNSFLLNGLVKCKTCKRALAGQVSKSGKFAYYICQSLMKRGCGACDAPRLDAHKFDKLVVGRIRANILTESSIRDLVRLVDDEMDGVAAQQLRRLETIDAEREDVKRDLDRVWDYIETSDYVDTADAAARIREHRERQGLLEDAEAEAKAILAERRPVLDDESTVTAFAREMRDFLNESELTERRSFIESFVKEIVVSPGQAKVYYTVAMPPDSRIAGVDTDEMVIPVPVLSADQQAAG